MRRFALIALFAFCSCPQPVTLPGDEPMGQYSFRADPLEKSCALLSIPDGGFDFAATYSRNKDGTGYWVQVNNFVRSASFDGGLVFSTHAASRGFQLPDGGDCACQTSVEETIITAFLSPSQNEKVGDRCPDNPLDGGVPMGPDSGVSEPGTTDNGYNAVRACGELREQVVVDGGCDPLCGACRIRYSLRGERR